MVVLERMRYPGREHSSEGENMLLSGNETLLLADDEVSVTEALVPVLTRNGYRVLVAHDGSEAVRLARREHPDLLILDIDMGIPDGIAVCRTLRSEGSRIPVIMLTKLTDIADKLGSFGEGADDYVPKPFESAELLARIRAVLRRGNKRVDMREARILESDTLRLNRLQRTIELDGKPIELGEVPFKLLDTLMLNHGQLVSHDELLRRVWNIEALPDELEYLQRRVRRQIADLREMLGDNENQPRFIETRRGYGYRFLGDVTPR
jgi:DNA-binding response OmpR family regulator